MQVLDIPCASTSTSPSTAPSTSAPFDTPSSTTVPVDAPTGVPAPVETAPGEPADASVADSDAPSTETPSAAADATAAPPPRRPKLFFDPHWLAIVRATAPSLSLTPRPIPFPPLSELAQRIEADYAWVLEHVGKNGDGLVEVDEVMRFARTAPTQEEWEAQGMVQMRASASLSRFSLAPCGACV